MLKDIIATIKTRLRDLSYLTNLFRLHEKRTISASLLYVFQLIYENTAQKKGVDVNPRTILITNLSNKKFFI